MAALGSEGQAGYVPERLFRSAYRVNYGLIIVAVIINAVMVLAFASGENVGVLPIDLNVYPPFTNFGHMHLGVGKYVAVCYPRPKEQI